MDKKVVHISVDLESLGVTAGAVILSAGLAAFTLQGGIVGTWYGVFSVESQCVMGRSVDPRTVQWWEQQSPAAKGAVAEAYNIKGRMVEGLDAIRAFIARFDNESYELGGVWGYGANFDNAALEDLAACYAAKPLWNYRKNRCGRTLVALVGSPAPKQVVPGVHHHALDDARFQAEWFRQCLIKLGAK